MSELVTLRNEHLTATIAAKGAELQSLIPVHGDDVIWSGDPAVWGWHAPNLFPIVGALADDILIHDGNRYPIKQHGFLRHSLCEVVSSEPESCAFRLVDSAETRTQYPFAFALTILYRLEEDRLLCGFDLANPASTPLYASLGTHPAFRWPLGDTERGAHILRFDRPEPEPIRRLKGRLLDPEPKPTPVDCAVLHLDDSLFDSDALIFDRLRGREVMFGVPGGPAVVVGYPDFPELGVWTKPGGAGFLCIEPWQGSASPDGFTGEFSEKPGVVEIEPGQTRSWRYAIRPIARMPD
jgi:galactose mutarotase-like enzyme